MLFVVDKPEFQRTIAIVRDDRTKKTQGSSGPFKCLSFFLTTKADFQFFHQAATKELLKTDWLDVAPEEDMEEVAEE